jgi:hypothetical protein
MALPITEIVTELAAQNPRITSEQITEIIIGSLESEPVISDAVSNIQVPGKSQIRLAELSSKRLPKKGKAKTLERIENASFFRRLQLIYIVPTQDSDLMKRIHRDGARVGFTFPIECSDSSYVRLTTARHFDINETYERIQTTKDTLREYSHAEITEEISTQNTKENKESSFSMLQEVVEEFEISNDFLSLYHIYQIIRIMEISPDQADVLNKIFDILNIDIKKRNRTYHINCIDELYRGDDSLPEELRVSKPSNSNISDGIWESLKAVILHEYKRLHNQYGQQFINGQITYDNYIQTTNRYSVYADRLFSELPV